MKKKLLTITFMLALSLAAGCNTAATDTADATTTEVPKLLLPADVPMNTVTVGYNDIVVSEYYNAVVTPYVEEYAFELGGYPVFHVSIGSTVNKGDLLVEIKHEDFDKRITELKADIEQTKLSFETENAEWTSTLGTLKSQKEDILSGKIKCSNPSLEAEILDYDIRLYETKLAQNQTLLELELKGLTDELTRLEDSLSDYCIYAPFSGNVIYTYSREYDWPITEGTTAIALADLSRKYIRTDYISDSYLSQAANIYATYDGATHKLTHAPITYDNPGRQLKNAQRALTNFVTSDESLMSSLEYGKRLLVTIDSEYIENTLSIPNTTLYTNTDGSTYVFIIDEDGVRTKRDITIGKTDKINTVVVDGLKEGEKVYVPD